jgi:hypothetical protein
MAGKAKKPTQPSFRDGPKDQTRNLEIPGSMLTHRPGMTTLLSPIPGETKNAKT